MKFSVQKSVAGATILSLITFAIVSLSLTMDLHSYDFFETPNVPAVELSEIPEQEVSLARLRRDEKLLYQASLRQKKWKRAEESLKILDETEDIWLRRSPELHAALKEEVSFKVILLVAI
jgi:hypothetical protein